MQIKRNIVYPEAKFIQDALYLGKWAGTDVPIYSVVNMHDLNQLVGYVKHINATNGTVLYRGQCKLYDHMTPSILHNKKAFDINKSRLVLTIDKMIKENELIKFFNLNNRDIAGWDLYQKLSIEAALQHYGAATFCVDFVDNHWTALWFGLYDWDNAQCKYKKRSYEQDASENHFIDFHVNLPQRKDIPAEPIKKDANKFYSDKIENICQLAVESGKITKDKIIERLLNRDYRKQYNRWKQLLLKISKDNQVIDARIAKYSEDKQTGHMFLFLYVADTNVSNVRGIYFGNDTYTIDLRKTLPSTFLRPCSQHGWIVRGKEETYKYESNIVCVIRVSLKLVDEMLGNGTLLSQENFFPTENIDEGYKVLLGRQEKSRINSRRNKILPEKMIVDFGNKTY